MAVLKSRNKSRVSLHMFKLKQTIQGISVLLFVTLFVPSDTIQSPEKISLQRSSEELSRFNRRYIRINDYLFNGVEDATAIAINISPSGNPVT